MIESIEKLVKDYHNEYICKNEKFRLYYTAMKAFQENHKELLSSDQIKVEDIYQKGDEGKNTYIRLIASEHLMGTKVGQIFTGVSKALLSSEDKESNWNSFRKFLNGITEKATDFSAERRIKPQQFVSVFNDLVLKHPNGDLFQVLSGLKTVLIQVLALYFPRNFLPIYQLDDLKRFHDELIAKISDDKLPSEIYQLTKDTNKDVHQDIDHFKFCKSENGRRNTQKEHKLFQKIQDGLDLDLNYNFKNQIGAQFLVINLSLLRIFSILTEEFKMDWCESDGWTGIEICHFLYSHTPFRALESLRSLKSSIHYVTNDEEFVRGLLFCFFEKLGFQKITSSKTSFPDMELMNDKIVQAELEYKFTNFLGHGHPYEMTDYVICWILDAEKGDIISYKPEDKTLKVKIDEKNCEDGCYLLKCTCERPENEENQFELRVIAFEDIADQGSELYRKLCGS